LDKLGILYTNADGLVNNRQELKVLINYLQIKPDIIAITKTKPKIPQEPWYPMNLILRDTMYIVIGSKIKIIGAC